MARVFVDSDVDPVSTDHIYVWIIREDGSAVALDLESGRETPSAWSAEEIAASRLFREL